MKYVAIFLGIVLFIAAVVAASIKLASHHDNFVHDCKRDGYFLEYKGGEVNCIDSNRMIVRQE